MCRPVFYGGQILFSCTRISQDVLGVSTGACTGAALAIILDLSSVYIQSFSFITGMLTVAKSGLLLFTAAQNMR